MHRSERTGAVPRLVQHMSHICSHVCALGCPYGDTDRTDCSADGRADGCAQCGTLDDTNSGAVGWSVGYSDGGTHRSTFASTHCRAFGHASPRTYRHSYFIACGCSNWHTNCGAKRDTICCAHSSSYKCPNCVTVCDTIRGTN